MNETEKALERVRNLVETLERGHMSHLSILGKQAADLIRVALGEK